MSGDALVEHWRTALRACRGLVDSREDAEDCASAAVLHLLAQTEPPRNAEAFVVTAGKRRAIDVARGKARHRGRDARVGANFHDVGDIADAVVERAEARWACEVALPSLSVRERAVLDRIALGDSIGEAARILRVSKRAAESDLHRARKKARTALGTAVAWAAAMVAFLRRGGRAAPTAIALSALMVVGVPFSEHGRSPAATRPGVHPPGGLRSASSVDGAGAGALPKSNTGTPAPEARRRPQDSRPTVSGPVASVARIRKGKTSDHEGTALEVLTNCLRDLQVDPTGTIGCSG